MQLEFNFYKMDITQDTQNKLLKRQELVLETDSETNPNFSDLRKQIAEKTSKPEENIDVYSIKGSFGKNKFKIKANIYESKQDLEKIKKLELTKKQRKEDTKPTEEEKKEESSQAEESNTEKPTESASAEDKPEQTEEKSDDKPTEAPVEERPEQEQKAVKEEKQAKEEAKEH